MAMTHDERSAADHTFLGLRPGATPSHRRATVGSNLARGDERLYGGGAIAISVAAAEAVTGRDALWMTTQFVSTTTLGSEIDVEVEVLAGGYRTAQVRVTATGPEGVVFASLGATGTHRDGWPSGGFERMPTVTGPEDGEPGFPGRPRAIDEAHTAEVGWHLAVDMRSAEVLDHPDPGPGRMCLWMRREDGGPITPALAGYLADMVPLSIMAGLGVLGAGTSLDNTLRVGPWADTEWLLLDLRPHSAVGGYGHGSAHLWTQDGHLLATASQTASLLRFEVGGPT